MDPIIGRVGPGREAGEVAAVRRAAKVDDNQEQLVYELRQLGYSVQSIATVGKGCPDLLVGRRNRNWLFEVKDPAKWPSARALTKDEVEWHAFWKGQVTTIETVEQALVVMEKDMAG